MSARANETVPRKDTQPYLDHAQIHRRHALWTPSTVTITVTQPEACEASVMSTMGDASAESADSFSEVDAIPMAASMPLSSAQSWPTDIYDEVLTGDQYAAALPPVTPSPSTTSATTPESAPDSAPDSPSEPTSETHVIEPFITRFSSSYRGSIDAGHKIYHHNTASGPSATATDSNQSPESSFGPPFVSSAAFGIGSSKVAFSGNGGIESQAAMVFMVTYLTLMLVMF